MSCSPLAREKRDGFNVESFSAYSSSHFSCKVKQNQENRELQTVLRTGERRRRKKIKCYNLR